MKVLIACEFSGIVRDAFIRAGHDAISCDLLPTEKQRPHIQDDVLNHLDDGWDLMIAHPPCTYLAVTGNKWFKPEYQDRFPDRPNQRLLAIAFFMELANAPLLKRLEIALHIVFTKKIRIRFKDWVFTCFGDETPFHKKGFKEDEES